MTSRDTGYRGVADTRATSRHRSRVRARGEAGAGQMGYTGSTIGFPTAPVAPEAPRFNPADLNQALISPTAYQYETDPRMGYQETAAPSGGVFGFGIPETPNVRTGGSEAWQPRQQQVNDPWNYQQNDPETLAQFNNEMTSRQQDVDSLAASAAGITAALQAEADMMRQQRDMALEQGLAATAAQYNQQIADIDKQIGNINKDAKNNNDISAWLRNQMTKPFDIAKQAAEAIDTAAATARTEAAVEGLTQAKLESDARLQGALESIGFEGLVGQIGIQAAQDMVAENAFLTEQVDVINAQGARQQAIADFERDLFIANADQAEATFNREDETGRLLTSVKLREALADATAQREKVEMAKNMALDKVRQDIGRQFGEGVTLPSEQEFVQMALQGQWDMIAGDLPDEDIGGYYDMLLELQSFDLDLQDEQAVRRFMVQMKQQEEEAGRVFDFDMEDIAILRQMDAVISGAYEEYARVKAYQGSTTEGNNRDPYNIAEVEAWKESGGKVINGPYAQRAAFADSLADDIRSRFGIKVDGDGFLRPLEWGGKNGRAVNSDHQTAGALDLYFTPGSQDTQKYKEVEAYVRQLQAAGRISSVVWLGQNEAHHNHIHISLALPYGGQKDFVDVTAGARTTADQTFNEQVDNAPGATGTGSRTGTQVAN